MASTDARPLPIKNTAYRATFPILDADGDLVTGATGLDSEVSKDAGTFADCTNEATEIATSSGMYYLDLTSTEMNADCVAVIVKTTSTGAKTTTLVLYPVEAGDIDVDVTSWNGTAIPGVDTAGYPKVTIKDGTGAGEIDTTSGGVLVAALAANSITATAIASDAITAAKIADGAIDRAALAADTGLQTIRSGTAQAGAAGTITLDASASATTDFYKGSWVFLTGGTGAGQARLCTAYNGTTKVATIAPNWATNPDNTSTFAVLPAAGVDLELVANAAVSTSTAQLGVNVVNFGGSAGTFAGGRAEVNVSHWKGTAAATADTAGYPVVTVKDGTGAGEIALTSGAIDTVTALTNAPSDSSGVTTLLTRLSATRAGYLDNLSAGAVALEASVQSVLSKLLKYVQLIVRKDSAIATDNATELTAINANGGSGGGAYANTTDAQEALRDRGDAAWVTATGFSTLDAAGVRTAVGLASANLDTQLTAIDDYLDTEVAAIKAKTDNLPASPAATGDIPSAATVADAVWDEAASGHLTSGTFGQALNPTRAGTAQAGSGTSITLDAGASATNDIYTYDLIVITAGTGAGQARYITAYNGTTKVATVATWQTNPSSDSVFVILPAGQVPGATAPTAAEVADAVWDEAATAHQTQGTFGQAIGDPGADTDSIWGLANTNLNATVSSRSSQTTVDTLTTRLGTPSNLGGGASVAANLADIEAQTDDIGVAGAGLTAIPDSAGTGTLLTRLSATRAAYLDNLSAGAVATALKLKRYVQLLARKDAAIATDAATELGEVNENAGSGAGAYANSTDSQEAIRDRGDAAWTTATGFSTLDAAGVRSAVGLASANLDTQLGATDTKAGAIKAKTDQLVFTTAGQVDAQVISAAANSLTAAAAAGDLGTEIATAVWASATRSLTALGFTLGASDLAADTIGASELAADAVTEIVNAVWTTTLTEAYNADGSAPTGAQALFVIMQRMVDFAISGTSITVKRIDGTTTAYTITLDDGTNPTSSARTS